MNGSPALAVVIDLIRVTLTLSGREGEEIAPDTLLFYHLSFTSMDLLELLFRVEEHFGVEIPEGTLYGLARGELPDEEFAINGTLTAGGRDRLMALLHDTPPELFPERIHTATLSRYCTVNAIARLVDSRLPSDPCSN